MCLMNNKIERLINDEKEQNVCLLFDLLSSLIYAGFRRSFECDEIQQRKTFPRKSIVITISGSD